MNYVLGCYEAGLKENQIDSWEKIDEETNSLVSILTYIVLFVNDQVYNYSFLLGDELKKSPLYRFKVKKLFNDIEKEICKYNKNIFRIANVNAEVLANITLSMEEDIKPHIDNYYYTISQVLLNHGISGERNRLSSLACVINMLSQTSRLSINDFGNVISKRFHIANNPLEYLSLDKIERLSDLLSSEIGESREKINLDKETSVHAAFRALFNNLMKPEVFEKAFTS